MRKDDVRDVSDLASSVTVIMQGGWPVNRDGVALLGPVLAFIERLFWDRNGRISDLFERRPGRNFQRGKAPWYGGASITKGCSLCGRATPRRELHGRGLARRNFRNGKRWALLSRCTCFSPACSRLRTLSTLSGRSRAIVERFSGRRTLRSCLTHARVRCCQRAGTKTFANGTAEI